MHGFLSLSFSVGVSSKFRPARDDRRVDFFPTRSTGREIVDDFCTTFLLEICKRLLISEVKVLTVSFSLDNNIIVKFWHSADAVSELVILRYVCTLTKNRSRNLPSGSFIMTAYACEGRFVEGSHFADRIGSQILCNDSDDHLDHFIFVGWCSWVQWVDDQFYGVDF